MCPLLELRPWHTTLLGPGSVCAQRCFRVKPDVGTRPAYTNLQPDLVVSAVSASWTLIWKGVDKGNFLARC